MNLGVLSLLVLYDSPRDAPGLWVVREQRVKYGGREIWFAPIAFAFQDEDRALDWLEQTGLVRLPRNPDDDPVIAGVWI